MSLFLIFKSLFKISIPNFLAMATPSIRPNPSFNSQQTAELLRKAMKGFGCDKGKIIQAIVNCSNVQRQEVG